MDSCKRLQEVLTADDSTMVTPGDLNMSCKNNDKPTKKVVSMKKMVGLIKNNFLLPGFLLTVSLFFHWLIMDNIYMLNIKKNKKNENAVKDAIMFELPAKEQIPQKAVEEPVGKSVQKSSPEKSIPVKHKATMAKKRQLNNKYNDSNKKNRKQHASPEELKKIGTRYMDKLKQGAFPKLILAYDKPSVFIQEMYVLGAKTIIYNKDTKHCYEINLLKKEISPFRKKDFQGFSSLKRVIDDSQWINQISMMKKKFVDNQEELELLLLVTVDMESRWLGYMVQKFDAINVGIQQIQTVEAEFAHGKLMLKAAHLKNGTKKNIYNDKGV